MSAAAYGRSPAAQALDVPPALAILADRVYVRLRMAMISIASKHELSHKKAKDVAEKIAKDLKKRFELDYAWNGDDIDFERPGVTGRMHVGKDTISLDVKLGFLLTPLKPAIEREIHAALDKLGDAEEGVARRCAGRYKPEPVQRIGERIVRHRGDRLQDRRLALLDRREERRPRRSIRRNAAKPRSRKSCSAPKPASRAGRRIIASAPRTHRLLT